MVDATVSFAIERLGDFLIQEVNTRIGVKDGVRWLKDELCYLQSSVRAAESRQEEELILIWINNVKDVANDAVTLLDRFSAFQEEYAGREHGLLDRVQSCMCICKKEASLHDIGNEIESLKGRVDEIKKRREEYGINNILATLKVEKRQRTILRATSFQNLVDVVGFEDDAKTLLAELVGDDPSLKVISIHGMGGLGKTTLASKLYHSSELSHFMCRAWVCVSQEYNIKDVLKTIIKSFQGHEHDLLKMDLLNEMTEVDLVQHLQKFLLDRHRYLAVIDDIWDIKAWEYIKKAFPDKNSGRVIVTTRNKKVAQRVDDRCFVHELRFLREDESWQLFCKRGKPALNLEKLGKEMVGKCRGLPLAIVVLSGILLHKKSYEDWSKMKDNIWRELKDDSVEIQEILTLSYDDLSFKLRQCFLYLARFPEDRIFEVDELKQLWIAEEFITEIDEREGLVMEDVAEDYLNELINRGMIQIANFFLNGQVFECRVHDLVRDHAVQKALGLKLLGIFDSGKQHTTPMHLLQGQPRHAIYNGIGEYLKLLGPSSDNIKLRSLAVINQDESLKLEEIKLIYTRFKYLKVLDLRTEKSEVIPDEIGKLVLLTFLGLMCGFGDSLVIPPTIGKLKKLQTLCGSNTCSYEFPREICELKQLRHLIFSKIIGGSLNIGSHQPKLQTLENLRYEDWIKIDTLNLTNLHTLDITVSITGGIGFTLESIANLTSLQTFSLYMTHSLVIPTIKPLSYCKRLKRVILYGEIKDISELSFLPDSITDLDLYNSQFTEDPMPTLGGLSNLTALYLFRLYWGKKMVSSDDAFPSLQFLKLESLYYLEEWEVEDGAMPCLKGFHIHGCEKLKMVPPRLTCVPPVPDIFMDYSGHKY